MSDSERITLKKFKESFFVQENYPYPDMQQYFLGIINRLADNPNADSVLKNYAGKVNLYWTEKPTLACIFSSWNDAVFNVADDEKLQERDWGIVFNPYVLFNEKELFDTVKEDHIAALFAHELIHLRDKVSGRPLTGKVSEASADIGAIDLLERAGYNPKAYREMLDLFPDRSEKVSVADVLDVHLPILQRQEVATAVLIEKKRTMGEIYAQKMQNTTPIPETILSQIKFEQENVVPIQNKLDSNLRYVLDDYRHVDDRFMIYNYEGYSNCPNHEALFDKNDVRYIVQQLRDYQRRKEEANQSLPSRYEEMCDSIAEIFFSLAELDSKLHNMNHHIDEIANTEYRTTVDQLRMVAPQSLRFSSAQNAMETKNLENKKELIWEKMEQERKEMALLFPEVNAMRKDKEILAKMKAAQRMIGLYLFVDRVKDGVQESVGRRVDLVRGKVNEVEEKIEFDKKYLLYPIEYMRLAKELREHFDLRAFDNFYLRSSNEKLLFDEVRALQTAGREFQVESLKRKKLYNIKASDEEVAFNMAFFRHFMKEISDEEFLHQIGSIDNINFDVGMHKMMVVNKLLWNTNNYLGSLDECLNLYKIECFNPLDADRTAKNVLSGEILKRLYGQDDKQKVSDTALYLFDRRRIFSDNYFKKELINLFADSVLELYGVDDGSAVYKRNIDDFVNNLAKVDFAPVDRSVIISAVADKLQTKRMLSDKFASIAQKRNKNDEEHSLTAMASVAFLRQVNVDNKELALIDFLQKDFSLDSVWEFQNSLVVSSKGKKRDDFVRNEFSIQTMYELHSTFWSFDLKTRAAFLSQIIPLDTKKDIDNLFDYVFKASLPPDTPNRDMITSVVKAYVNAHGDEGDSKETKMFYLMALMAAAKKADKGANFSVGEPLREFLENIGPAGVKLGQAIGSYPNTPPDVREQMQELKKTADRPSRYALYDMVDMSTILDTAALFNSIELVEDKKDVYTAICDYLKYAREQRLANYYFKDEVAKDKLGDVIGSGSYFVTLLKDTENNAGESSLSDVSADFKLDSSGAVFQVLRPFSQSTALRELDILGNACQSLEKDYPELASSASQIIETADKMVEIETDMEIAKKQILTAREMYPKTESKMQVGDTQYDLSFNVANWLKGGLEHKTVQKLDGVHFNDLPAGAMKTAIAKEYFALELNNILQGKCFDHDRHGAQMKVLIDEDKKNVKLNLFDNGAMALRQPDNAEKERLGKVLDATISRIIMKRENPAQAFTNALTQNINSAGQAENDKTADYILTVQRGVLALGDFMREIPALEAAEIFISEVQASDEMVKSGLSPANISLLSKSSGILNVIKKIRNIQDKVDTFSTNFKKKLRRGGRSEEGENVLASKIRKVTEIQRFYLDSRTNPSKTDKMFEKIGKMSKKATLKVLGQRTVG